MSRYLTVCQTHQSTQRIPYLSPFLSSGWRNGVQLLLQVNTPIFVDNETGREGHGLNMVTYWGCMFCRRLGDSSQSHSNMCQKVDWSRYRFYLLAVKPKGNSVGGGYTNKNTHSSCDNDYKTATHIQVPNINRQLEQNTVVFLQADLSGY